MGVVQVCGGDFLQGLERFLVLLALSVVDQAERVIGVQQLGGNGNGVLQGGGGAVVFAEGIIGNAEIGIGTGVFRGYRQGPFEFLASAGVVVLVHVDHALVVVPTCPRGQCRLFLRRFLFASCAEEGECEG